MDQNELQARYLELVCLRDHMEHGLKTELDSSFHPSGDVEFSRLIEEGYKDIDYVNHEIRALERLLDERVL